MYMYIYIYTYIQAHHRCPAPNPLLLLLSFYTAREAHSARGLIRRVLPGVSPRRYQVAKCACSAGPDLGSLLSISGVQPEELDPDRGSDTYLACSLSYRTRFQT